MAAAVLATTGMCSALTWMLAFGLPGGSGTTAGVGESTDRRDDEVVCSSPRSDVSGLAHFRSGMRVLPPGQPNRAGMAVAPRSHMPTLWGGSAPGSSRRFGMVRAAEVPITSVVHGDAHSGSAHLDSAGRACWLDRQVVHVGHWATDVNCHIATSLDVNARRVHERELLQHCLDCLTALVWMAPGWEEAGEQYALHLPYGYFLGYHPDGVQSSRPDPRPGLVAVITDRRSFRRLGVA